MPWQQVSITTGPDKAPEMADFFSRQGALSVTYMDAEDEPVYEPGVGEVRIWSNTQVIALFEQDEDVGKLESKFSRCFQPDCYQDWKVTEVADQVWERVWLEHYHAMKFGGKLWVCPTGQINEEAGTVCLVLDPGLAFGTGTHPTTALCLQWLAGLDLRDKTVIDFGCGSGILAIAAVLLGAKIAYGVDIDPQALTATAMNAEKNGVQGRVIGLLAEEFEKQPVKADILVANILAKPLIDMADQMVALVAPNGLIGLSGILAEQADAVVSAYQPWVALDGKAQQEDWVRLTGAVS